MLTAPHKVHSTSHKEKTSSAQVIIPNTIPPVDPSKKPIVAKLSTGNSKVSFQGNVFDSMTSKMKSKSTEIELGQQPSKQVTSSKRPDCIEVSHSLTDMHPSSPSWSHKNSVTEKCSGKGDPSAQGRSSGKTSPVMYTRGSLPSQRHSPYGQSPNASHHSGSSSPRDKTSTRDPLDSPTAKQLLAAALVLSPKSSPQHSNPPSTHNSPINSQPSSPSGAPHKLAYEDNAFSMYPFEYGSFQDLPPATFGRWCE